MPIYSGYVVEAIASMLVSRASVANVIGCIHIFAIVYVLIEYIVDNTTCTFVEHFVQCWSKNQNVDSQNG